MNGVDERLAFLGLLHIEGMLSTAEANAFAEFVKDNGERFAVPFTPIAPRNRGICDMILPMITMLTTVMPTITTIMDNCPEADDPNRRKRLAKQIQAFDEAGQAFDTAQEGGD